MTMPITIAQKFQFPGPDLDGRVLITFGVLPVTANQLTSDTNLYAGFQVLPTDFSQAAEGRDAEPVGMLLLLAGFVGVKFVNGNTEIGYWGSFGSVP